MEQTKNRIEQILIIIAYLFAALLPLWVLPWRIGVELGREVSFGVLLIGMALLWLLSGLTRGGIRFHRSPLLWACLLLVLAFGVSTYFSKSPLSSLFFSDVSSEKLSTLLLGITSLLLLASVLKSEKEAAIFTAVLLFSGAVSGALTIATLLLGEPPLRFLLPFAEGQEFNVVGTMNGLSLFYAALFSIGGGMLLNVRWNLSQWKKHWADALLALSLAIFLANLFLINFLTSWIVLLGAGVLFLGIMYQRMWHEKDTGAPFRISPQLGVLIGFLALSIVMVFVRQPLMPVGISSEVAPSFRATWNITQSVFSEGTHRVLFGSGPGTFGLDWARYKDPSLNLTPFWDTRFGQGHSWFSTLMPTVGLVGAATLLIFLGTAFFFFLRKTLADMDPSPLKDGLLLGFTALVFTVFLYPANFSILLLLFSVAGVLGLLSSRMSEDANSSRGVLWKNLFEFHVVEKVFVNPWSMFLSSLLSILFIAVGFFAIYGEVARVKAALGYQAGVQAFGRGNVAEAIAGFSHAAGLEGKNLRHAVALIQAETQEVETLIGRAARGEDVRQEFQTKVGKTIQDMQWVARLYPEEPLIWRAQGALYGMVIPFVPGSEQFAFDAYRKAVEKEPTHPRIWLEYGKAKLRHADRLQALIIQSGQSQREELEKSYAETLRDASETISRSVALKQDYAEGHFLLAQVALRRGNREDAIRSAEQAKASVPFDVGTAFQLGLLYYQSDMLKKAEEELSRALSINQNYSNARYFLGLVYDRTGQKGRAIEEFVKVAALNPGNAEIEKILENLRKGKSALTGIAPPGTAPESRNEVPVNEGE